MSRFLYSGVIKEISIFKRKNGKNGADLNKKDINFVYNFLVNSLDSKLFSISKCENSVVAELKKDFMDKHINELVEEVIEICPDIKHELFYEDEEKQENFILEECSLFQDYKLVIFEKLQGTNFQVFTQCYTFARECDKYVDNEWLTIILLNRFAQKCIKNELGPALLFFVD